MGSSHLLPDWRSLPQRALPTCQLGYLRCMAVAMVTTTQPKGCRKIEASGIMVNLPVAMETRVLSPILDCVGVSTDALSTS